MIGPVLAAALLGQSPAVPAAPPPVVAPVDIETSLNGLEMACTGVGMDARSEPRWQRYGVRIELSDARSEYLAGGTVTVRDASGRELLRTRCDAPWLLLRLPAGAYVVEASVADSPTARSAHVQAPRTGQLRVVLQFPDL